MPQKLILILGLLLIFLSSTTNGFAVVGHPSLDKPALSKQEKRKLKRQQKLLNFAAKIQHSKIGEYIPQYDAFPDSTACDTIVLNNGKQITAMIFGISNQGIEYLRCDQPNRTKVLLSQRAIKEIRYLNGDIDNLANLKRTTYSPSPIPQNAAYYDSQLKNAKTIGIIVGIICGIANIFGLMGLLILSLAYMGRQKKVRRYAMKHAWIAYGFVIGLLIAILLILNI